ncbi:MAG: glutathione peroxidase [Planctomycetota bacterium]
MYGFELDDIDGNPVKLAKYGGKALLIVNVASKCGFTRQYAGLQALYEKYGDRGFAVLGFPANNFGGQEPGTNEQIKQFCTANYNVTFPMFSKISVKGDDKHPLYQYLTGVEVGGQSGGEAPRPNRKALN